MEEKRFATVMWGGFDFIADAGGSEPERKEWLMECSGLQASSPRINNACCGLLLTLSDNYILEGLMAPSMAGISSKGVIGSDGTHGV